MKGDERVKLLCINKAPSNSQLETVQIKHELQFKLKAAAISRKIRDGLIVRETLANIRATCVIEATLPTNQETLWIGI